MKQKREKSMKLTHVQKISSETEIKATTENREL